MSRIGAGARLPTGAGRWQVHWGGAVKPPHTDGGGGKLGFWYVHEIVRRDAPPFRMAFRVQRDAQQWADTMNLRAP
jgi:hypothetical protein